MTWTRQWEMGDPVMVCARMEEASQRNKSKRQRQNTKIAREHIEGLFERPQMTEQENDQIEHLLDIWYEYERAYRAPLGAPKVSVSCRDHDAGDVHIDAEDRDDRLNRMTAQTVGKSIDELDYQLRAAIGIHCRNKLATAHVHRNPRADRIGEQQILYKIAKSQLYQKLKRSAFLEIQTCKI